MKAKQVVRNFYELDLGQDTNALSLFHKDCELHWNSSKGFTTLHLKDIQTMLNEIRRSYVSFKYRISHLLEDDNTVTARYTIYVIPIENPEEEEEPLAHFISIWEVKDGKLFKGYEISQMADENPASLKTFSEIKV